MLGSSCMWTPKAEDNISLSLTKLCGHRNLNRLTSTGILGSESYAPLKGRLNLLKAGLD